MTLKPMAAICWGAIAAVASALAALAGLQIWHLVGVEIMHPREIATGAAAMGFALGAIYGWRL